MKLYLNTFPYIYNVFERYSNKKEVLNSLGL